MKKDIEEKRDELALLILDDEELKAIKGADDVSVLAQCACACGCTSCAGSGSGFDDAV